MHHLINPMEPQIAKVIAANSNGGTVPLAVVKKAKKAHSNMAIKPTRVAVLRVTL